MSIVQRARARYYQVGGYPLSSLSIFDVEEAKRTHSLEYLQQVTNLCEKIKLTPEQFDNQSQKNKLKFIKAFQYSISYSQNLKSIYDSKQQELTQRNSLLMEQIKSKKSAIKLHKQKVDKRKVQYRQMKVDQVKNVYQTFSNEISNLKSKQQELNVIKMQLQSDIQLAKHQLVNPYPQQQFYQQTINPNFQAQQQNFNDPTLHYSSTNSNLHNQNQGNQYRLNSPHFNSSPGQGFPPFNNQTQQKKSKHKNQQSNFTLNQQWTILDEENHINQMDSSNKQQHKKQHYKIKINSGEKKQDKEDQTKLITKSKTHNLKLDINKKIHQKNYHQKQGQEIYSPTVNLKIKDEPDDDRKKKSQQEDSFDDLNEHLLMSKKSSKLKTKQQKRSSSSIIDDNDSILLKKLNLQSKVSKKSSYNNYDEYQFQHQIKQTPNLHFSVQSNKKKNDLSYSKMGQVQGDLWTSTKGSGDKSQSDMKLFNNQPKRKKQEDGIKNTIGSIKQSDLQQSAHKPKENNKQKEQQQQESYQNEFDDIDDLDDLDLGMETRNSIAKAGINENKNTKPVQMNMKKTLQVSIRKLQQVPQETQSDITKKGSIIHPPALKKTQQKDYPDEEQYQQDYEEQFQDQIQESKNKEKFKLQKQQVKNNHTIANETKSEVEIIVPSNTSIIDTINTSKQNKIFRDLDNETFQPINQKVQNKAKGVFPDLKVLIDSHLNGQDNNNQHQQQKQNEFNTINTEQMLESDFDILQQTTYGKKPKNKQSQQNKKTKRNNLDESNKLLILDHPLESIILKQPATTEIIESTTFNNTNSSTFAYNQKQALNEKKVIDDTSLTQSIPLKKTLYQQKLQDSEQIIEQDEDSISQQIEYQFQDSSKINQSQKQQIEKKIVSLVRNKNKIKSHQSSAGIVQKLLKQIQNQIEQQIKINVKQSKQKMKENDWKQITKNFQNKINEFNKQSTGSQLQKKLTQIQQKNTNTQNNEKPNQSTTTKQNLPTNSKPNKHQFQESQSEENIDLNYSQSILKDQLKTQFANKKKLQLSEVASVNQGLTNSSKAKNQSLNSEDSELGFSSLKEKSFIALKNQQKQKKNQDEKIKIQENKQQVGKFKKTQDQKAQIKRDNKLMGVKQEVKTEQASRSKYVKSITPTNNKSVSKQNAFTKLQQNKYVSIQDPLNNQIALKKPILQKKVSNDDDDDF